MNALEIHGRDAITGAGLCLRVEDGRIAEMRAEKITDDILLSAGLIDLQVNGYRGYDLNCAAMDAATVSAVVREMLQTGVTTFAPTLITASQAELLARLHAIAQACESDPVAAACIGFIHVEGPYISPLDGYLGAHPAEHVRPPSIAEFEQWQQASGNRVGMVTLSPHYAETVEYVRHLVARGVLVSIGHTHASTEQVHAAVEAGATLSTHLGNAMAAVLKRHPNPIWSQLAEEHLQAMLIADGHHLAPEVFRVMLRAKGLANCILVSDCVALAGMPPGKYTAPIGGTVELTADGRLRMEGTELLAGAAMPLIDCVGAAVRMSGLPLSEMLPLATSQPGRLLGGRGQLTPGARADIIAFRWDPAAFRLTLENVWLAGGPVSLHRN